MCKWNFVYKYSGYGNNIIFGSGALPGKMLLVRIIENNEIILGQVRWSKGNLCPVGLGKVLG